MPETATAQELLDGVIDAVRRSTPAADGAAGSGDGPHNPAEVLKALESLRHLRRQLDAWEPLLIETARAQGVSWARLAPVLEVTTRQAAERRYLRLRPGLPPDLTREERVQAARDERAGDRAVAAWARENASSLRQIAGRVSALTGLSKAGRRDAEALATSLVEDDPGSLIGPLADMRVHLVDDHDALAAQVEDVGRQVGRVRRETQRRRDAASPPSGS
jgi:hypothetical protein